MIYTIQNKCLSVSVRTHGAELCSVRDVRSGREFLWQGDESVWNGQSPLLFPNVGRIRAGKCKFRGQDYPLPMHGFANRMEFELEALEPERICLFLRDTEETRRVYPFSFALRVEFFLNDDAVVGIRGTISKREEEDVKLLLDSALTLFDDADADKIPEVSELDAERKRYFVKGQAGQTTVKKTQDVQKTAQPKDKSGEVKKIFLRVPSVESKEYKRARAVCEIFTGSIPAVFYSSESAEYLTPELFIKPTDFVLRELSEIVGEENSVVRRQ